MYAAYGRAGESVTAWEPRETRAAVKRCAEHASAVVSIRLRVPADTTDAELVALVDAETARLPEMIRQAVADCRRHIEPPASPWIG
jgi:hypothetical protein